MTKSWHRQIMTISNSATSYRHPKAAKVEIPWKNATLDSELQHTERADERKVLKEKSRQVPRNGGILVIKIDEPPRAQVPMESKLLLRRCLQNVRNI